MLELIHFRSIARQFWVPSNSLPQKGRGVVYRNNWRNLVDQKNPDNSFVKKNPKEKNEVDDFQDFHEFYILHAETMGCFQGVLFGESHRDEGELETESFVAFQ